MKVSYNWLNEYFDGKLPAVEKAAEILTMNSSEVDGMEKVGDDMVLDVKILPNMAHSSLCHRGIAGEFGALLDLKPKKYCRNFVDYNVGGVSKKLKINIEDSKDCRRYIGRVIEGIKIGPSPEWLKTKLENLGQRSINNLVDATNFVMMEIGQPMHVFDANKIIGDTIEIKRAKAGESMTTLDDKIVSLDESILTISNDNKALAVAGVKGGVLAEIDSNTENIILESANFNATLIRKTAQKIKIQTDATKRYENDLTPDIAFEAMDLLTKLIVEIASTPDIKIGEMVDIYPNPANQYKLGVSVGEVEKLLGIKISSDEIKNIFRRLNFEYKIVKPIDEVLKLAPSFVGVSYKWGASVLYESPKSFDCSAFLTYLFAQNGVLIPRVSVDQYIWGAPVLEKDIKAGDAVYLNTGVGKIHMKTVEFLPGLAVPEGVDHCGLYLGDGKIIHCTSRVGAVVIEDLKDFANKGKIVGYRRMSDNGERFVVTIPEVRLDLRIKEDLIEEILKVHGYNKITDDAVITKNEILVINKNFYYANKIKKILADNGFSEICGYTFTETGDIELANSVAPEKKFLRNNLSQSMAEYLEFNARYSELVAMPQIKIFEISKVFGANDEHINFIIGVKTPAGVKGLLKDEVVLKQAIDLLSLELKISDLTGVLNKDKNIIEFNFDEIVSKLPEPTAYDVELLMTPASMRFKKISIYPFSVRDVAVFTTEGTTEEAVWAIIEKEAGSLLMKDRLFDVFTKKFPDGTAKTSYGFRLVLQSYDHTLSEEEINIVMTNVTNSLNAQPGWQVR